MPDIVAEPEAEEEGIINRVVELDDEFIDVEPVEVGSVAEPVLMLMLEITSTKLVFVVRLACCTYR